MLRQTLSVVIPVFRAGAGLGAVVRELLDAASSFEVAPGVRLDLDEVVLVCDNPGLTRDERAALLALEDLDRRVHVIWLTTNFGQHPATIAGIVSTNGDWLVTMDEDGQHDPRHVPAMLLTAARANTSLTYASPTNPPPHGALRNAASRAAKAVFQWLSGAHGQFHSFRLVEGPVARSACAYVGENVYLDVALRWACGYAAYCPLPMRAEHGPSSYRFRTLVAHFWRMILSTGTRPLRVIALGGILVALIGVVIAAIVLERRLVGAFPTPGWTSVMMSQLILIGGLFVSLAVVAEYVGFAVRNTIGKPLYITTDDPQTRVLRRLQAALEVDPGPVPAGERAPAIAP
ncbi:MAG TPA: glycosyltransferase [Solirubrobacteraceae bacterium]